MLACLEHNDKVRKFVSFFLTHKSFDFIVCIINEREMFQDSEHYLRIDSCHSKSLHEAPQTILNMICLVILPLKVMLKTPFASIVFATENFSNLINHDPSRIHQNFGCNSGWNVFINLIIVIINGRVELLRLFISILNQLRRLSFILDHLHDLLRAS